MTLKDLPIGKTATVTTVGGEGALRQHFLDMGLIPKADVTMVKFAPMGDPVEVRIHGYELTLRLADAEKIEIDKIRDTITEPMRPQDARPIFHPPCGRFYLPQIAACLCPSAFSAHPQSEGGFCPCRFPHQRRALS